MILAQCRARFILNKPKSEVNQKNVAALKSKRMENTNLQNNIKQAFKSKHKRIRMSEMVLVSSACQPAASRVHPKALCQRKKNIRQMLCSSIRLINSINIQLTTFGFNIICVAFEPYFYDTVYAPIDWHSAMSMSSESVQKNLAAKMRRQINPRNGKAHKKTSCQLRKTLLPFVVLRCYTRCQ